MSGIRRLGFQTLADRDYVDPWLRNAKGKMRSNHEIAFYDNDGLNEKLCLEQQQEEDDDAATEEERTQISFSFSKQTKNRL